MIDLIFAPLLEFGPLGNLNNTTISMPNSDGTMSQKAAVWYNSQSTILFGDSCSWLIGLGRMTNVCGPDLKVICDWTIAVEWIPGVSQLSSKFPNFYGAVMGTGGSTDVILGGKDLFNYGATTDVAFTRKKYPSIKVEKYEWVKNGDKWNINFENYFPGILKAAVFFPYLLLLSSVVTARLAYMQVGVFSNQAIRDQLQKWVSMTVPLIESRWVSSIKIIEQLFESGTLIKRLTKIGKHHASQLKWESENILKDASNLAIASTIIDEVENEYLLITHESKKLLRESKSRIIDTFDRGSAAISIIIPVPTLENVNFQHERSTGNKIESAASFQHDAENKIEWKVHGKDTSAKIQMDEEEFESSVEITPVQVNTITPIGSINVGKNNKGVDISVNSKEAGSVIQLQHKGGDRSQLNIYPSSLEIQSGSKPLSAPSISLKDGTIVLRTGLPDVGPKITLTDNKIVMSLGLPTLGSKITMTATSIDVSAGKSEISLTPTGIEQKVGEIVSLKLDFLQQKLQTAENSLKIAVAILEQQTVMTKENSEAIHELTSALAKYEAKAITTEKAALTINQ